MSPRSPGAPIESVYRFSTVPGLETNRIGTRGAAGVAARLTDKYPLSSFRQRSEAVALHLSEPTLQNNRRNPQKNRATAAPPPPSGDCRIAFWAHRCRKQSKAHQKSGAAAAPPPPSAGRSVSSANRERGTSGPALKKSAPTILGGETPRQYSATASSPFRRSIDLPAQHPQFGRGRR